MDSNDIELVQRDRYDSDEVYPGDELHESETSYQPGVRKQNLMFVGSVAFLLFIMAVGFGAKVWFLSGTGIDFERESDEGTVSNNQENDKINEALNRDKKNKVRPGHAVSGWAQSHNQTAGSSDSSGKPLDNGMGEPGKESDGGFEAWRTISVTKDDGVMYKIVDVLVHDPTAFLEGLTFFDGKLWESVGLSSQSAVKVLDPDTGETLENYPMDPSYFGEGLTYCKGKLIQLTYKKLTGFVYDVNDLSHPLQTFQFSTSTGEGWGLTYDEKRDELIVSDGSAFLHFWDPDTFKQKRKHQIMRLNGKPALQINELEWWRDRVVANVWYEHVLLIINPVSGLVEKEYDFSTIWQEANITPNQRAEVFNGISISSDPDVLYVTGKLWSHMFKVKLLPELI